LTEEQRQEQQLLRPYVLDTDKHGVGGLREVATGKFYYNLDIVMIEIRLSNGYYKRFKDFYDDIKRIAKDAKTSGDRNRTISANELVANVEVDMMHFETTQPALASECEAVYLREVAREKAAKANQAAPGTQGPSGPAVMPVPPQSMTTTENSGPVVLGELVPGPTPFLPPVTPRRPVLSNGDGTSTEHQTNGSTVPSRGHDDDIHMADPEEEVGPAQRDRAAAFPSTVAHSGANTQQMRNQRAALEKMAPGSQVDDYHNSASTTTSGQKTNSSNRTSGHSVHPGVGNTQSSNGTDSRIYPVFSTYGALSGGSQIPDTQENSERTDYTHGHSGSGPDSGREILGEHFLTAADEDTLDELLTDRSTEIPSSQHTSSQSQPASSQNAFSIPKLPAHAVAANEAAASQAQQTQGTQGSQFTAGGPSSNPNVVYPNLVHHSNITAILNPSAAAVTEVINAEAMEVAHPPYNLADAKLAAFRKELVSRTSGFSVEQLEQIMAGCVDAVWKSRGRWDRDEVIVLVLEAFRGTVGDIEGMQGVLEASYE
jgi:ATPase family AAA domain-containing protein 2